MRKKFAEDDLLGRFRLKQHQGLRIDPKPTPPEEVEEAAKALEPLMETLEVAEPSGSDLSIDWDTNDFEAPDDLPSEEALRALLFGEPETELSLEEHDFYKSQRHQKMLELLAKVEALTHKASDKMTDPETPTENTIQPNDPAGASADKSDGSASTRSTLETTHFPERRYDEGPEGEYDEESEEEYDEESEEEYDEGPEGEYDEGPEGEYDEEPEGEYDEEPEEEAAMRSESEAKQKTDYAQMEGRDGSGQTLTEEEVKLNVDQKDFQERLIRILNENYSDMGEVKPQNLKSRLIEILNEEYAEDNLDEAYEQEEDDAFDEDYDDVALPETHDVNDLREGAAVQKDEAGFLSQDYDPYRAELTEDVSERLDSVLTASPKASKSKFEFREYQYVTSFHEAPDDVDEETDAREKDYSEEPNEVQAEDETADHFKDAISSLNIESEKSAEETFEETSDETSEEISEKTSEEAKDEATNEAKDEVMNEAADEAMDEAKIEDQLASPKEHEEDALEMPSDTPEGAASFKHEHPGMKALKKESALHRWTNKAVFGERSGSEDHRQNETTFSQEERFAGAHVKASAAHTAQEAPITAVSNGERGMSMEEWSFVFDTLKEQIDYLKQQLEIKDHQLQNKDELIRNFQILLKNEQDKFLKLENKMEDVVLQVEERATKKGFFSRFRKR